jgi:aspartyl-tRNA(Asn)/glutamyl-tRNA(Gln) amidotransferase subunit C
MDITELKITASLAMVELHDDEIASLSAAVNDMLDYFALMEQIDVEGLEPTTHAFISQQPLREDIISAEQVCSPQQLVARSAEQDGEHFIIPNVL